MSTKPSMVLVTIAVCRGLQKEMPGCFLLMRERRSEEMMA
jgi:hypothetical protein